MSEQNGLFAMSVADHFNPEVDATILAGDAAETIKSLPDGSAKLVITSPPYNIGKVYEKATHLEKYLDNLTPIVDQLIRVMAPDGAIFLGYRGN